MFLVDLRSTYLEEKILLTMILALSDGSVIWLFVVHEGERKCRCYQNGCFSFGTKADNRPDVVGALLWTMILASIR